MGFLAPVFATTFLSAVDDAVVLPTLWPYLRFLGADTATYGLCLLCYYLSRMLAMPAVGVLCDRTSYGLVFKGCILLGTVASLGYTVAPAAGKWRVGVVMVSRMLLGVSSSASVASLAFISEHVATSRRTEVQSHES